MKYTLLTCLLLFVFSSMNAQLNIQLRAHVPYSPLALSNIGGYVDTLGNEYALVGTSAGLSIVDVSNPDTPSQVFTVPGVNSIWREVKTYRKFAYVVSENGGGVKVVNLSQLPDTMTYTTWSGDSLSGPITKAHALHIDTARAFLYLFGTNIGGGKTLFIDISDPSNPHYAGSYSYPGSPYVHDGYVENDTLFECHIYQGFFTTVDVSNKSNPVSLGPFTFTPGRFTHNAWISGDHQVLFTTDEVNNSHLTAYDISDLNNITELSRFQTAPGSNATVHNTHIINDFAVTSWYTEGVVITDVSRPANPIQVGKYDTYPQSGGGQNGCWGVYPFLPSGNLVVSDMLNGLYVLTPAYRRGCYLEGIVVDSISGTLLQGATVTIVGSGINKITNSSGEFRTGMADTGTYDIYVSKPGYFPKTVTGVFLDSAVVTPLTIQLVATANFTKNGIVLDNITGQPIPSALVKYFNGTFEYNALTDANGEFSISTFYDGSYSIAVGKWGHVTHCDSFAIPLNAPSDTFYLAKGYYDDFVLDLGWTVSGISFNSWERVIPVGTTLTGQPSNPGTDVAGDCKTYCYDTDNGGGSAGSHDVDEGNTVLTSPVFDPTYLVNPAVECSLWFFNAGGTGAPNDSLNIYLSDGTNTILVQSLCDACGSTMSAWVPYVFPISSFLSPTSTMQLIVSIADDSIGHIVEGGLDLFRVTGSGIVGAPELPGGFSAAVFPNPSSGSFTVRYNLPADLELGKLNIVDITGRVVESYDLPAGQNTIEAGAHMSPGTYFASISSSEKILQVMKLVKMKAGL